MDKAIIFIIIAVILVGGIFWAWQAGVFSPSVKPVAIPEGIILFYGDGCPHCVIVDDFIKQNKIEEKVKITRLEVWNNKSNQNVLAQVAQKCGITTSSVGVPFLFDGNNKCYIGEVDVPNFLKVAAGIK